jgi:hypothetical protein
MTETTKIIKTISLEKTFLNEAKTRRHKRNSISGNRLRDWMEQLYRKKLKKCRYEILKFEFIHYFETNDNRVIEKYIGRPKDVLRYSGSNVVRLNRQSGKLAKFDYMNERRLDAKDGLAQILGYITIEDDRYILHHEKFSYAWSQTELSETAISPLESEDCSVESIRDLCVSRIGVRECSRSEAEERQCGSKDTREEEESYRAHTQICDTSGLTRQENRILRAEPRNQPDRAKTNLGRLLNG